MHCFGQIMTIVVQPFHLPKVRKSCKTHEWLILLITFFLFFSFSFGNIQTQMTEGLGPSSESRALNCKKTRKPKITFYIYSWSSAVFNLQYSGFYLNCHHGFSKQMKDFFRLFIFYTESTALKLKSCMLCNETPAWVSQYGH